MRDCFVFANIEILIPTHRPKLLIVITAKIYRHEFQ
jgi:hypothetical protein